MLIADGAWDVGHMANVEELDPKPFIDLMNRMGLVTRVRDAQGDRVLHPQRESALTVNAKKRSTQVAASYYAQGERGIPESRPYVKTMAKAKTAISTRNLT